MLNFKPLNLEDKITFDKYLKPYTFSTCEYSFTNLFIWRKGLDVQYCIINDVLIIKKMDFHGYYHFMQPIGYRKENLKEIIEVLMSYQKEHEMNYLFKDAETSFVHDVKEIFGDKFIIEEDRDNSDYIYDSSKLSSLSGKKLHGKKNHYNNFIKNNTYHTELINEQNIEDCLKAACEWCKQNDCKGYLKYELKAIQELLTNSNKLDFIGMAVYVNDILSAFTIGEKVNDDMAIIHIEKASANINGLYAFVNKTFVETCFSDIPFINREQDLGKEGLRKAKLSYYPVKLEPKYSIY
ncbi:phosphatidylglycerol lysyltransferase domain-containing protein [Clostridium swellfunianum]|uniref:DUF2156 domain-containing protein n=1 Tax=Clostridium swellfunianum TaxID=1367462 RepID=UPI00202E5E66|nr:phosphatidylglycerol lysyltransferase domain-containing protein [Clostridium swellfunianum]MCM0649859.1 phosphatidylglycerol lysyltransferase domain-containing protein [Clostridium swellfunianum]